MNMKAINDDSKSGEVDMPNNIAKNIVIRDLVDIALSKNMPRTCVVCESSGSRKKQSKLKCILELISEDSDVVMMDSIDIDFKNCDNISPKNKSELEQEMEIYEAVEREEEAKVIVRDVHESVLENEEKSTLEPPMNDKKRLREGNLDERKKKRTKPEQKLAIKTKNGEDVCFICFDGGDLVLCDRRSCPKAYHLGCIDRDKAFFIKKGSWFCGSHFCSNCKKIGNYLCYTCPTSYCKLCIKKSEFHILHKRKGLCEECLPIVSMIERNTTINKDGVRVDFEDKETYECLFKDYWIELKNNLSFTISILENGGLELKDSSKPHLKSTNVCEIDESDADADADSYKISQCSHENLKPFLENEGNPIEFAKLEAISQTNVCDNLPRISHNEKVEDEKIIKVSHDNACEVRNEFSIQLPLTIKGWASNELKTFLENMKKDANKPLSRFAVHKILWMYIKKHKLQNPRKMSDIICDKQLQLIFGQESIGQFEMFKILNKHFPSKTHTKRCKKEIITIENKKLEDISSQNDVHQCKLKLGVDKVKRKSRKTDELFQRPNSDEYAAINYKNISLIYLRRSILEEFIMDPNFERKVVGTFVKIRVLGNSKVDPCYRLVLITGTGLQKESYMAGSIMTNLTLSILNLQKKESITIEMVSNQDFTEEECERLRLNIKCGFLKTFTVGQLGDKAISLQEAKVNDWIENERQRLINLRDRASEKGRKKELRECVERLQELNSPTFRAEKMNARPEILADPHMDPNYDSDDDGGGDGYESDSMTDKCCTSARFQSQGGDSNSTKASWGGNCMDDYKQRYGNNPKISSCARSDEMGTRVRAWKLTSDATSCLRPALKPSIIATDHKVRGDDPKPRWNDLREDATKSTASAVEVESLRRTSEGRDPREHGASNPSGVKKEPKALPHALEGGAMRYHAGVAPLSVVPTAPVNLHNPIEQEKLWHYVDPSGTIQGPFSIEQLRKWNGTGLFPIDLKIWKISEDKKQSILLTEGLQGKFNQSLQLERSNKKQTVTTTNKKHNEVEAVFSARRQANGQPNGLVQPHCETKDGLPQKKGSNQVTFVGAHPRRLGEFDNAQKGERREPDLPTGESDGHGEQTSRSNAARPSWINQSGQEINNVNKDEGQSSTGHINSKIPCTLHLHGYC